MGLLKEVCHPRGQQSSNSQWSCCSFWVLPAPGTTPYPPYLCSDPQEAQKEVSGPWALTRPESQEKYKPKMPLSNKFRNKGDRNWCKAIVLTVNFPEQPARCRFLKFNIPGASSANWESVTSRICVGCWRVNLEAFWLAKPRITGSRRLAHLMPHFLGTTG